MAIFSGPNLHAVDKHGIDGYIATDREEKPADCDLENTDRKFVKADFEYDAEADVFICPNGRKTDRQPCQQGQEKKLQSQQRYM